MILYLVPLRRLGSGDILSFHNVGRRRRVYGVERVFVSEIKQKVFVRAYLFKFLRLNEADGLTPRDAWKRSHRNMSFSFSSGSLRASDSVNEYDVFVSRKEANQHMTSLDAMASLSYDPHETPF